MSTPNTHEGPARILSHLETCAATHASVFFIGVGGIMMSSLALLTARAGHPVFGSDRTRTALTDTLTQEGVTVLYRHTAENIPENCGLVVYTVAISEDNPEYTEAQKRGIPCISRADYLGALMTGYTRRVGVAGMHGKSTCTSMCAQILLDAEVDPTILSGATYAPMGGAYRLGHSKEHFLFEACEYMDSFLDFNPTVSILLGAELEHVDYFKDMEQIIESFARYASLTGRDGVTVVNLDDPHIMESAKRALTRGKTGGLITFSAEGNPAADFTATHIHTRNGLPCFELIRRGESLGQVTMAVPGRHQVINALAAAAAMDACDIPAPAILSGLAHYVGAGRRMEYKGEINGGRVYDDYGHHPTEIKATLEGAKALCAQGSRLICIFQPHTYSRTAALYGDFLTAFDAADKMAFIDIYAAREDNIYGVSSAGLATDINAATPDRALYCPTPEDAAEAIRKTTRPGDVVVVMGAGDVIKVTQILFG
ncbi:MAG: UDP-N-acetylmuramate--L-alanine ligase [Clostridia bacterium]|nr:UDP-N-acetylmuramate--L-alanine ligase [Clostridia bacterium]